MTGKTTERLTNKQQGHFRGNCEQWNFKDAVQFGTVVLVVESDELPTKNIRECCAKETQLSLISKIVASCLYIR